MNKNFYACSCSCVRVFVCVFGCGCFLACVIVSLRTFVHACVCACVRAFFLVLACARVVRAFACAGEHA